MGMIIFDDCQDYDDHTECTHVGGGRHDEFWTAHNERCRKKAAREAFMAKWWPLILALYVAGAFGLRALMKKYL